MTFDELVKKVEEVGSENDWLKKELNALKDEIRGASHRSISALATSRRAESTIEKHVIATQYAIDSKKEKKRDRETIEMSLYEKAPKNGS